MAIQPRPRLFLTPATLTYLKAQVTANSTRWQRLKDAADRELPYDVTVPNYALAYLMTGSTVYSRRAITLMQQMVDRGLGAITGTQGYRVREILPDMAIGYDWCYDRIPLLQRNQFRTQMEQWADWVWPDTNPSRAGAWGVDNPRNNYFNQFMISTWLTGLTLHGDSAKAPDYIDLALTQWNTLVKPWLLTAAAGGYLEEGTHYGNDSVRSIFSYLTAHQTAMGEDLLGTIALWSQSAFLCQLYLTTPTRDHIYPGGDQAMERTAELNDYRRAIGLFALAYMDDTTAGFARHWLDTITPNINQWRHTRWEEFLRYRTDRSAIDYTQVLPLKYFAPGTGLLSTRTSWAKDATMLVAVCGDVVESHQDRAANAFMLFRGDWLAAHARLKSQSGLLGGTEFANCLLIGGQAQQWETGHPRVLRHEDAQTYTYFCGEASGAYQTGAGANPLRLFQRDIVFLKGSGVVIVLDTIDVKDATQPKQWLLQTLNGVNLGTDTYRVAAGGSDLVGTLLLPSGSPMTRTTIEGGTRLTITAPTGQNVTRFLNVLQSGAAGFTPVTAVLEPSDAPNVVAVWIGTVKVSIDTVAHTVTVQPAVGPPPPSPPLPPPTPEPPPTPPSPPVPVPPPVGTATRHVSPTGNDGGPGTQSAPWRTLQRAADGAAPGDVVSIADGEYAGFVMVDHGGTFVQPITFRAAGAGAIVRGDQTPGQDAIFVSNSNGITIDGLTVLNARRAGIRVSLSDHVTIRNCRTLNNWRWGIFTDYSHDLLIEDNECAGSVDEHGIYVSNSGDRPIIRRNHVHHNNESGIQVNADPAQIEPTYGARGDGIIVGAVVEGNHIHDNGVAGAAAINLASVRNSRIVNNLIYHNLAGGIAGWDNDFGNEWGSRDNLIAHNTIYFRPNEGRWAISLKNGSASNIVRNNVVVSGRNGCLEFDDSSLLPSDYNLLLAPGGVVATNEDRGSALTFAQWRALGNEVHGLYGDPRFVAVGTNFRLGSGSPAIDAGDPSVGVTTDLVGAARPAGAKPDLGCYELAATPVPPVPPVTPPPTGVNQPTRLTATTIRATLTWTQSTSPSIRRNRVYRRRAGETTRIADVTTRVSFYVADARAGDVYWVTAVDSGSRESIGSATVTIEVI